MASQNTDSTSNRILAFDLLRGYFMFMILVDHVGRFPSLYDIATGRGQMWVSAAEGFFFMSGLLVSITKSRKVSKEGMRSAWISIWKRAAYLYAVSSLLTLGFTAWAYAAGSNPGIKGGLLTDSSAWTIIWQTLSLQYTYGWTDFLSHYAVFMFFAPIALYALHKGQGWAVVAASLLVWVNRGSDFTKAWQIIFYSGMLAGYYLPHIRDSFNSMKPLYRRMIVVANGALVVTAMYFSATTVYGAWPHPTYAIQPYFVRNSMEVGRIILFFMCFGFLFYAVRRFESIISAWLGWLLIPYGKNSLYVYVYHGVVVFALDLILPKGQSLLVNVSLVTAVLASAWLCVRFRVLTNYIR